MKMSLWLWRIQNSWHRVSAPPKVTMSPAPRKSKIGFTSMRADMVSPSARAPAMAMGA